MADCSKSFYYIRRLSLWPVLLPRCCRNSFGLGCSAFARHYLRNHCYFLFLRVMRCFSSPRLLPFIGMSGLLPDGLPHSEIRGSRAICALPRLFAAYHVLLRFREPRHPPCALFYYLLSQRLPVEQYTYCFSLLLLPICQCALGYVFRIAGGE